VMRAGRGNASVRRRPQGVGTAYRIRTDDLSLDRRGLPRVGSPFHARHSSCRAGGVTLDAHAQLGTHTRPGAWAATRQPAGPVLTRAQQNARESAESYLDYSAFSRSGLIDQLVYEQYSKADATIAVDSLNVDWQEQAYKSAKSYLDYSSFSLPELIDQLEYEAFSKADATYGASKAYNE
jgi:hypothetical protein